MKTVVLFGAGQVGTMVCRLIGTDFSVLCFADNNEEKWETAIGGIPIVSPEKSLSYKPDYYCVCVTDDERADILSSQIRNMGFNGPILSPRDLRVFDSRVATMRLLAEQINREEIPGDIAELGVFRGDFAALLNSAFTGRTIHLFDTFEGFDSRDISTEKEYGFSRAKTGDFSETAEETVLSKLPYPEMSVFHKGYFPDTFAGCENLRFAFVSIDADLYAPTAAALPLFYDRLSPGGVLLIHDVNSTQFLGAGKAVEDFCHEQGLLYMPVCDLHGSAVIRK